MRRAARRSADCHDTYHEDKRRRTAYRRAVVLSVFERFPNRVCKSRSSATREQRAKSIEKDRILVTRTTSQPGRRRSKRTAPVRRVRPVDVARAFHRAATRDAMQAVAHRAAAGPTAVARRASAPYDISRAVPACHRQLDAAVPARVSSRRAFRRGGSRRGAVSVSAAHFEAVQAISDLAAGVGLPCTVRPPSTARRAQSRRRDRGSRRVHRRFRRRADRRRAPLSADLRFRVRTPPPAFHDTDPKLR